MYCSLVLSTRCFFKYSEEMPVAADLQPSPDKPAEVAAKTKNGLEKTEATRMKKQSVNAKMRKSLVVEDKVPLDSAVKRNASTDSSCSSDTSSTSSAVSLRTESSGERRKKISFVVRSVKRVQDRVRSSVPVALLPLKRCDWITPHSDPQYITFHDQVWGIPVHEDQKLFELFILSMALAEHSWSSIIQKRAVFRKLLDDFNPSTIANFSEETLLPLNNHRRLLLSEPKLRAIVENARQVLKIQEEFGSFAKYCWRFVNHRPIRNGHCYARQVPVKTPKAEYISKDLLRRGFRSVGPTIVYAFMQVSGMVNDHLVTCFRYEECNARPNEDMRPASVEAQDKEAD